LPPAGVPVGSPACQANNFNCWPASFLKDLMVKYDKKIEKAKSILEEAEEELLLILWEDDPIAYLNYNIPLHLFQKGN